MSSARLSLAKSGIGSLDGESLRKGPESPQVIIDDRRLEPEEVLGSALVIGRGANRPLWSLLGGGLWLVCVPVREAGCCKSLSTWTVLRLEVRGRVAAGSVSNSNEEPGSEEGAMYRDCLVLERVLVSLLPEE
jgi:hypothetical protein